MIYQTGTIATTAGQTKITGTGTRWKDNLAGISEGCPISYLINNTVFMNTVLSVNSDTEINLTYPVPVAASAAKYQIATFVLDSMSDGVRKILANQQYIQYFLRNMDAWMTQDGIVEVKTPTGETVRLESIRALKSLIDAKLDNSALNGYATTESVNSALNDKFDKKGGAISGAIDVGGNITSKNDVIQVTNERTGNNIQLDTTVAGRLRINTKPNGGTWLNHLLPAASGTLMQVGDYGVGATYTQQLIKITDYSSAVNQTLGFIYNDSGAISAPSAWGGGIRFGRDPKASSSILYSPDWNTRLFLSAGLANGKMSDWVEFYSTGNTTKDSNGNLKAASPVIKVYSDHVELNDESEGVELEKLGTGRYKLKGTLGMNSDASWGGIHGGLVVPNGINNLPLVWADFDVLPDGDIIIETRYRKHTLHPRLEAQRLMTYPEFLDENNVEREDYDYCDIPNGHWIDVRVNMPSDSIYNQKLAEAERLAKIEAERVAKEEAEKTAREEAERLAKIEAERVAKEEAEKTAREEAERLEEESKQEQARKLQE